ncbi:ABC transporter ATP-binding protein [Streptomyces sp. B1866]|uniref:ABC transporter ATP-binding protein n=1 Tax=Streptomyces sp. B1866 TaxID=3075431 RepID=UPI0028906EFC|nr:ABC transporter ATP-binding protein [Streptomyces sp. B1866]MDT3397128.1 ABC transporter ATP-binding protein [Streptomyces sp. B1866]
MQISDLPFADPGRPDTRSGLRFLLWLGRRQWSWQAAAGLWGLVQMGALVSLPVAIGMGVQAVVDRSDGRLALAGGLMAALTVFTALGETMTHRASVANWVMTAARVQQLLARQAARLGAALPGRVPKGELATVATSDVDTISHFAEALPRFTAAAVTTLATCVALVVYQPALGVVVAAGVPALALGVLPLMPRAARRAEAQREKAGRATELASDTVAGLRVLRGIGGEELFLARYRTASQEVRAAAVRGARTWASIAALQVALPGLLLIGVVWYGGVLAREGRIEVGELVTVYSAITFLLMPLQHFEQIASAYSFAQPSAQRVARVLSLGHPTAEPDGGTADGERLGGDLHDPLTGLVAPAGRLTAVVCGDPDAAGRLAERLGGHVTTGGAAAGEAGAAPSPLLGGVALDDVPLAAARAAVLVQDKDPVLLSGTLTDLFDIPRSGAVTVAEALEAAQCGDVLEALARASADDGAAADPLRARITERGRSLSGGQRQRLALARSLLADPGVLVLDEPTSAVDSYTEARIADGLRGLRAGRTTVVFTASPLLLDRADRVVFVHEGSVAAAGTHRTLLRAEPAYRATVSRETDPAQRWPAGRADAAGHGGGPPGAGSGAAAGRAGAGKRTAGQTGQQIEESA